jgi:hypothetical protein
VNQETERICPKWIETVISAAVAERSRYSPATEEVLTLPGPQDGCTPAGFDAEREQEGATVGDTRRRGRAKVALASLILSLILSAHRNGPEDETEHPVTGAVTLLTVVPRVLHSIARIMTATGERNAPDRGERKFRK